MNRFRFFSVLMEVMPDGKGRGIRAHSISKCGEVEEVANIDTRKI